MRQRNDSPELIMQTVKAIRNDVLTVGFARRFATYQRAHLLFTNEAKLRSLVSDPARPMQFIFAGKAHPHDRAGQDLIRRIIDFSRKPEFIGKIIFVENYDMILAKKLISGCDVWLNTPTRPLEASGTSGEKAVMNGVLNFSVLDGWWAEGYVPGAGWAVDEQITYTDNRRQDELDAANLFYTFEEQIKPAFYNRTEGIPTEWVTMMKNNFARISPHFTMKRQLDDYYEKFYSKLSEHTDLLKANNFENLNRLVQWKGKMLAYWGNIEVIGNTLPTDPDSTFYLGATGTVEMKANLGNISPDDVKVELVFTRHEGDRMVFFSKHQFKFVGTEHGISTFVCTVNAKVAGVWNCAIRMIPQHPLLAHDMELNLVKWC
jgi:glucan phosphorylase